MLEVLNNLITFFVGPSEREALLHNLNEVQNGPNFTLEVFKIIFTNEIPIHFCYACLQCGCDQAISSCLCINRY